MSGIGGIKNILQGISQVEKTQQELQMRPDAVMNLAAMKEEEKARHNLERVAGAREKEAVSELAGKLRDEHRGHQGKGSRHGPDADEEDAGPEGDGGRAGKKGLDIMV